MKELKLIEYLPRWYEKEDVKAKKKEIDTCISYLLKSNKLKQKEIEELADMNFYLVKGTYSKNYMVRRLNEIITYVSYR